jgi:hypothetical protein
MIPGAVLAIAVVLALVFYTASRDHRSAEANASAFERSVPDSTTGNTDANTLVPYKYLTRCGVFVVPSNHGRP